MDSAATTSQTPSSTEVPHKKGIAFEICYRAPLVDRPPQHILDYTPRIVSPRQLIAKLQRAEDRRLSCEAKRIEALTRHNRKAWERSTRKSAETAAMLSEKREAIRRRMDAHTERRDALINNIRHKLQTHSAKVEVMQLQRLEKQKSVAKQLEHKASVTEKNREANTKARQYRLHQHNEHVEEVRRNRMFPEINGGTRRISNAWV